MCGEFIGPRWIPRTKASDAELWCFLWSASVTRSLHVFSDLRPNKPLSKQSWCCWFETLSRPLWRHCNGKWAFLHFSTNHSLLPCASQYAKTANLSSTTDSETQINLKWSEVKKHLKINTITHRLFLGVLVYWQQWIKCTTEQMMRLSLYIYQKPSPILEGFILRRRRVVKIWCYKTEQTISIIPRFHHIARAGILIGCISSPVWLNMEHTFDFKNIDLRRQICVNLLSCGTSIRKVFDSNVVVGGTSGSGRNLGSWVTKWEDFIILDRGYYEYSKIIGVDVFAILRKQFKASLKYVVEYLIVCLITL